MSKKIFFGWLKTDPTDKHEKSLDMTIDNPSFIYKIFETLILFHPIPFKLDKLN